jgi:hypothetical protein
VLARGVIGRGGERALDANAPVGPPVDSPVGVPLRRLALILLFLQGGYCLATAPILFDRHLLIMAPAALVVATLYAASSRARFRPVLYGVCLIPAAFYSVAGTHDLHAISRGIWRVGESLLAEGIDSVEINAGYAFDGWHTYDRLDTPRPSRYPKWWDMETWNRYRFRRQNDGEPPSISRRGWWFGQTRPDTEPRYIVAPLGTEDLEGVSRSYAVDCRLEVTTWWPPSIRNIVVLTDPEKKSPVVAPGVPPP